MAALTPLLVMFLSVMTVLQLDNLVEGSLDHHCYSRDYLNVISEIRPCVNKLQRKALRICPGREINEQDNIRREY